MNSKYNHKDYEEEIYKLWEKSKSFMPSEKGKAYTIILPPPNANAPLHYGHAMYAIEDVLIRYHRLLKDNTLWLPGADHAGFETQVVFEKQLEKDGKSRFDYKQEDLYKMIWDFVQANRGTMETQLKKLGFSLDWSKLKFTLDPDIVKIVYKTFKKLCDDGFVYRDKRLVNYCTKHGTAFSDLEVEHVEKNSSFYFIKYQVKNSKDFITVATTRPETIPGDTAIAVNPKDKRYKNFIGKKVVNPLNGREMPVIADTYVKTDFGTGALKVTPAHDENDFVIGKKYDLKSIQVIDFDGKLNYDAGKYAGLKVIPAREAILKDLKDKGLLEKEEVILNSVGTCYKCGNVLEPLPLPQWYIKAKELAKPAITAVRSGKIEIIPKRFVKIYFNWLNNIHDWNISRQVVWGIRIPAWECEDCHRWSVTEGAKPLKCEHCNSTNIVQDKDTFDTWFSSGQWPFATLKSFGADFFKEYYPTSVMETGYDILFFWVARMVMLGLYVTKKVPFKTVYLHGIVRDSHGQKMSKSKGNVINPLEIVDKYGADALRMSLISGAGAGNDQNYSEAKVVGFRNFTNKIWNIGRFVELNTGDIASANKKPLVLDKEDITFLKRLSEVISKTTKSLNSYKLNIALETIYEFTWHELADNYIETSKNRLKEKDPSAIYTLVHSYFTVLILLHPFAPFITEAIWQELKNLRLNPNENLITSSWPTN